MMQAAAGAQAGSQPLDLSALAPMLQQVLATAAAPQPASASTASAATASGASSLTLRVCEAGGERNTFRQVTVQREDGRLSFQQVETRIAAKFRSSRGPDGKELGLRRLVALVRIADKLEVADDEDVELLKEADELEASFAALGENID